MNRVLFRLLLVFSLVFFFKKVESQSFLDSTTVLTLNRVLIIGNNKTKEWIITRELNLKKGDTVSIARLYKVINLDKNKLYNLRLFHTVQLRILDMPDKTFDLFVEVEERWYTWPIPLFELSDRNFNEWWQNYGHKLNRTNYGLRLYQWNFRGRNEFIRLTAQTGFTRKFDLLYRIPYIDKRQKQGLIFDANYSEPKNLAYRTLNHKLVYMNDNHTLRTKYGFGVTYTYRKNFYNTHLIRFDYDNTHIADTVQHLINSFPETNRPTQYFAKGLQSQWYIGLTYQFIDEHRDVVAYPLNGYQITATLSQYGLGVSNVNQTLINGSWAYHKDIGKKFYFSNFSAGYWSTPKSQPYYMYFGMGYRKQFVRGYEIYVLEGPWYALNKTTLKHKIFQRTYRLDDILPWERFRHFPIAVYLKAYADFGYARNYSYYESHNLNNTLSNRLIGGVGLGLDIVSAYDGVFRIEYTINRQGAHGFFFHIKKEF